MKKKTTTTNWKLLKITKRFFTLKELKRVDSFHHFHSFSSFVRLLVRSHHSVYTIYSTIIIKIYHDTHLVFSHSFRYTLILITIVVSFDFTKAKDRVKQVNWGVRMKNSGRAPKFGHPDFSARAGACEVSVKHTFLHPFGCFNVRESNPNLPSWTFAFFGLWPILISPSGFCPSKLCVPGSRQLNVIFVKLCLSPAYSFNSKMYHQGRRVYTLPIYNEKNPVKWAKLLRLLNNNNMFERESE